MSLDPPLFLHVLVLVVLIAGLLHREIDRLLSRPSGGRAWEILDAAVPALLVLFVFMAGTRLAELL